MSRSNRILNIRDGRRRRRHCGGCRRCRIGTATSTMTAGGSILPSPCAIIIVILHTIIIINIIINIIITGIV